jgi:WD40 repeat protein
MGWPLSQDYNEAVQSPRTSFADPELREGQAAANALGIPMPRSGNFADVYELCCPGGARWAVKCFTREVPGLRERYALISDHLRAAKLPFTVDFHYLEQGVRIQGRWYPVLKMQWVEGFTLNEFVRDSLDKPATLEALLQIWVRMARRLRDARIAHADLQHGNVLLVPGSKAESLALKLIDYDGMWVPALADKRSGEVGHPAYQHPRRLRDGTYSAEVDRFPLLAVAAALRCLQAGGRALWDKYDTGDNLLFREADFKAPEQSPLFGDLRQFDDVRVRGLAVQLMRAALKPLEATPLLEEVMAEPAAKSDATPVRSPATPRPAEVPREVRGAPAPPEVISPSSPVTPALRPAVAETESLRRSSASGRVKSKRWLWVSASVAAAALLVITAATALTLLRGSNSSEEGSRRAAADPDVDRKLLEETSGKELNKDEGKRPPKKPHETGNRIPSQEPSHKPWEETLTGSRTLQLPLVMPSVALSQDGRRLVAVGSSPSPAYSFDLDNPNAPPVPQGDNLTRMVAFTPDGQTYASLRNEMINRRIDPEVQSIRFFRADTGQEQRWFAAGGNISQFALFPDGTRMVSCGLERAICLWDIKLGKKLARWPSPSDVWHVDVRTGNDLVAAACNDGKVLLYSADTGMPFRTLEGHNGQVTFVTFSQDGKYLLSCGAADRTIRLWDVSSGQEVRVFRGHRNTVRCAAFSPDERRILSVSEDRTARLWDTVSGKLLDAFPMLRDESPVQIMFSRSGRFLIASHMTKVIIQPLPPAPLLVDTPLDLKPLTTEEVKPPPATVKKPDDPPKKPDEAPKKPAKPWEQTTFLYRKHELPNGVRRISLSPDGRRLLAVGEPSPVHLLDLDSPVTSRRDFGADRQFAVAFAPDGQKFFVAGSDKVIRLCNAENGEELKRFEGHQKEVYHLAVFPDGKRLVSCGPDNAVFLWDVETGKLLSRWDVGCVVHAVAVRPSGDRVLAACDDGRVRLFDVANEKLLRAFEGHAGRVQFVTFSPDGKYAASCGDDRTVRVWDIDSGGELRLLKGHGDTVWSVDFSPDGRRILSAGGDRTVRLWETESGKLVHTFGFHNGRVMQVLFARGGQHAISGGSEDKSVVLLPLPRVPLLLDQPLVLKPLTPDGDRPPPATVKKPDDPPKKADETPKKPEKPKEETPTAKAAPPDSDARAKALKQIREVYKKEFATADTHARAVREVKENRKREYANAAFDDQKDFANKLFKAGLASRENAAERYVLLREAAQRAGELGLMSLADHAVDELAKDFDINAREMKLKVAVTAGRSLLTLEGTVGLLEDAQPLYDELFKANDFDGARELVAAQASAAKALGYAPLANAVQDRHKRADALKREHDRTRDAEAALAKNPDEPKANRDVGRFLCLYRGDWDAGLRALAKGGDEPLCALARKDLAGAGSADHQVALGEAWAGFTEVKGELPRLYLQRRAGHWFRQAVPRLEGERKAKYENLVAEADRAAGSDEKPITLFSFLEGKWVIQYSDKNTREYTIQADGTVEGTLSNLPGFKLTGKLSVTGNALLLDLNNMNKERFELLTLKGNDLLRVAQWANGAVYPAGRPTLTGEGFKKK